ncbi:MAG: hypothetical protein AABZ55_00615 [Bdellovibrionota bacterium]
MKMSVTVLSVLLGIVSFSAFAAGKPDDNTVEISRNKTCVYSGTKFIVSGSAITHKLCLARAVCDDRDFTLECMATNDETQCPESATDCLNDESVVFTKIR